MKGATLHIVIIFIFVLMSFLIGVYMKHELMTTIANITGLIGGYIVGLNIKDKNK